MTLFIIAIVALFLLALAVKFIGVKEPVGEYRKARFMSEAEVRFYKAISEALGPKYRIFAKPRLNDIVYAVDADRSRWQSRANKLRMKHVDFLLCDPTTLAPACVIELDDSSHSRSDRAARDGFVNNALKAAGIPIAHFPVRASFSPNEISQKISEALGGQPMKQVA
ncbi:MAG: DUF2726 domain-containing protein [Elusimicrobiota bacterium]